MRRKPQQSLGVELTGKTPVFHSCWRRVRWLALFLQHRGLFQQQHRLLLQPESRELHSWPCCTSLCMVNYCIALEIFKQFQILPDSPATIPGVNVFPATSLWHLHLQGSSHQLQTPCFSIVSHRTLLMLN